ncbi:MAG TPA: aspartate aminotransferase, partial [Armatimonadota bacterium]|nr:aspartate aminotransferase [Armatimonadota bacterium]
PGSGFGAPDYIRLSYATSMSAITNALDRMAEAINKLK